MIWLHASREEEFPAEYDANIRSTWRRFSEAGWASWWLLLDQEFRDDKESSRTRSPYWLNNRDTYDGSAGTSVDLHPDNPWVYDLYFLMLEVP